MPPHNHVGDWFWVSAQIAVELVPALCSCQRGEGGKAVKYIDMLLIEGIVRVKQTISIKSVLTDCGEFTTWES